MLNFYTFLFSLGLMFVAGSYYMVLFYLAVQASARTIGKALSFVSRLIF